VSAQPSKFTISVVLVVDSADAGLGDAAAHHHGGRVVDVGPPLVAVFPSAVDALGCALDWRLTQGWAGMRFALTLGRFSADSGSGGAVDEARVLLDRAGPGELWISDMVLGLVAGKVPLVFELPPGAIPGAGYRANFDADPNQSPPKSRRIPTLIAAALVVAVAGAGLWFLPSSEPPRLTEIALPENMVLPLPALPSLAVVPFAVPDGNDVADHVALGIFTETVRWLGTNPDLFVVDSAGAADFTAADIPARVAQALGVRFVFQAALNQGGEGTTIEGSLVDALSGAYLWEGVVSANADGLSGLGYEMAKTIFSALGLQVLAPDSQPQTSADVRAPDPQPQTPADVRALNPQLQTPAPLLDPAVDPEAYDLFLQGRARMAEATPDANVKAQALFLEALEIDPTFAAAAIEHGFTVYFQAQGVEGDLTGSPLPELEQSVSWALAANPNNPRGLALSSRLMMLRGTMFRGQFDDIPPRTQALDFAQRAVATAPNDPDNLVHLARLYNFGIRTTQEGLELTQKAMRINPKYPWTYQLYLAQNYQLTARYAEAIQVLLAALQRKPDSPVLHRELALAYVLGNEVEAGRSHMEELLRLVPGYSVATESQESIYLNSLNLIRDVTALRRAGLPFAYRGP
jgi:TolB-like protein/tetratricopeptide (TPR) repeat protein